MRRYGREKRFLFILMVLLLTCLSVFGAQAKQKKKAKGPRILVVDSSYTRDCSNAIGILKACGARVSFSRSRKIDAKKYNGLVIPGGVDINPKRYGQKNTASRHVNSTKDSIQLAAVKAFADAKKPIFGICRGEQLINVYFGGTLKQHIGGHMGVFKKVHIKKDSFAYSVLGSTEKTAHNHHQCVSRLGTGLVATQWSYRNKKKVIEAVEHKELPIYGTQWHPEYTRNGRKLMKKFVKLCAVYKPGS